MVKHLMLDFSSSDFDLRGREFKPHTGLDVRWGDHLKNKTKTQKLQVLAKGEEIGTLGTATGNVKQFTATEEKSMMVL